MRKVRLAAALVVVLALGVCAMRLAAQEAPKAEPRRVELTEGGTFKESNCLYVMTKDVTAKGCGFAFEGKNYVVDLGGHTLTFNAEPYEADPKAHWELESPYGILLKGEAIELRNGTVIQGAGNGKQARCVFLRGKDIDVHDLTVVVGGGWDASGVFAKWGGSDVRVHHNYIVCAGPDSRCRGIDYNLAAKSWDIHHNTLVGGHTGIRVCSNDGRQKPDVKENVRIHHNFISHMRTRQQKTPQGIETAANFVEIDHNEICSVDGRGLKPSGNHNNCHHNIVDVRYTRTAEGGFYPENRCYGYWIRDKGDQGNRVADNLFVVNNEVVGDGTSSSVGILLCTSPGDVPVLPDVTVTGNRIFVRHKDPARPALGFELAHTGDDVVVKDNYVWADTAAVDVDDRAKGAVIEGNTFVKAGEKWQETIAAWESKGEGIRNCTFKDNRVVPPPTDKTPPGAPRGLTLVRRFNGFELHWEAGAEADVLGYYVYRNGQRLDERMKCTRFWVDATADPRGVFVYAVSAVDTSGNEGPPCPAIPTTLAKDRLELGRDDKPD